MIKHKIIASVFLLHGASFIASAQKHVIGAREAGLFSNFLAVLNHTDWCLRNKHSPVVYWGQSSYYYTPAVYNGSVNAWEYYFEPTSSFSYEYGDVVDYNYPAPDGYYIRYMFDEKSQPNKQERWEIYLRLIEPYIRLNKVVQSKIDTFYDEHMRDKHVIGIHLRGTDKKSEVAPVPINVILQEAKKQAAPDSYFFVATDDATLLDAAKKSLKERIIYCMSHQRSSDGRALHYNSRHRKACLGEEVVIEAMLLARCNKMIHTNSNVSTAVLFLNPDLENIMLSEEVR